MNFLDGSLFPENQEKLVITAAPYGPEWMPSDFPEDIPVTMEEQVQKAVDCYNAGATVLHLHVRELDGKGSQAPVQVQRADRRRAQGRARHDHPGRRLDLASRPESDGAAAKWLSDDTRHMLAELDPKPDQVTVAVNTTQMNVVEQMDDADIAGTSLAEPANYQRLPRDDRARRPGLGRGARPPPERRRHPERLPALQHQQLETVERLMRRGVYKGPLVMNWVAIGGGMDAPTIYSLAQLHARHPRRRDADGRKLHAQRAAAQHDGHRHGPARALRHRGQPLEPVAHREDVDRASRSSSWCASRASSAARSPPARKRARSAGSACSTTRVEETLAANGFAPNPKGRQQGFLRKAA